MLESKITAILFQATLAYMGLLVSTEVWAQGSCPEPLRQIDQNISSQIRGQLSTIGRLGAGEIEARTERTAVELLSRYPNADRVAIAQNLISVFCNQLNQSRTLSESEKFDLFFRMQDRIERIVNPRPVGEIEEVFRFAQLRSAEIQVGQVDDIMTVWVNGTMVERANFGQATPWRPIRNFLRQGPNAIMIDVSNGIYGGCQGTFQLRINGRTVNSSSKRYSTPMDKAPVNASCAREVLTLNLD